MRELKLQFKGIFAALLFMGPAPSGLHKAIDYSVFPGGARIRPCYLDVGRSGVWR